MVFAVGESIGVCTKVSTYYVIALCPLDGCQLVLDLPN